MIFKEEKHISSTSSIRSLRISLYFTLWYKNTYYLEKKSSKNLCNSKNM